MFQSRKARNLRSSLHTLILAGVVCLAGAAGVALAETAQVDAPSQPAELSPPDASQPAAPAPSDAVCTELDAENAGGLDAAVEPIDRINSLCAFCWDSCDYREGNCLQACGPLSPSCQARCHAQREACFAICEASCAGY